MRSGEAAVQGRKAVPAQRLGRRISAREVIRFEPWTIRLQSNIRRYVIADCGPKSPHSGTSTPARCSCPSSHAPMQLFCMTLILCDDLFSADQKEANQISRVQYPIARSTSLTELSAIPYQPGMFVTFTWAARPAPHQRSAHFQLSASMPRRALGTGARHRDNSRPACGTAMYWVYHFLRAPS